jgi:hypothetical protein
VLLLLLLLLMESLNTAAAAGMVVGGATLTMVADDDSDSYQCTKHLKYRIWIVGTFLSPCFGVPNGLSLWQRVSNPVESAYRALDEMIGQPPRPPEIVVNDTAAAAAEVAWEWVEREFEKYYGVHCLPSL